LKRSQLRPDPEKVRAWMNKSQEAARERARTKQSSNIPKPRKSSRVEFRPNRSAKQFTCERCKKLRPESPSTWNRAVHWHHWLPQESLRVYVRGLRLPQDEQNSKLLALLHDRRNISALCLNCHGNTGTLGHQMRRSDVKQSAFTFAAELGTEWLARLERSYPI
jgi:hypothetical protein